MTPGGDRQLRRWPGRLLVAVLVLASVAAAGWFVWLPQHRPALLEGEQYGIDVSHHQGEINWERVAAQDVSFVYMKATEGGDHLDTQFARNWEAATAVGIPRGAYHFFTLCRPGREQAENFLATVPDDPDALPPAVDLELAGNCAARPDQMTLDRELGEFLDQVERATGRTAVLYVGPEFDELYGVIEALGRPLWQLSLLRRPDIDGLVIWQVMGFARIDGIDGRVDLNVARVAALQP